MYLISKQLYLDKLNKCYKTIIIINSKPEGELKKITTNIKLNKLTSNGTLYGCCNKNLCVYAFVSIKNCCKFMCIEELPELITYLTNNNYKIDYQLTKLLSKHNKDLLFAINS